MATKTAPWVKSALSNDSLVADLLLTLKHSSSSLIKTTTPVKTSRVSILLPPGWSHKKNRSKSGGGSKGKEQRGSPTTHLSWSACSASDGGSDLYPAVRSVKANESASTSNYYNKSQKRKTFVDLKDEEGPLLNGRIHIKRVSLSNQESTSKRVTLNQPMVMSENSKRIKIQIDSVQNRENKLERRMVKAETEATTTQRGFVLPDLNMAPDEDMIMMS